MSAQIDEIVPEVVETAEETAARLGVKAEFRANTESGANWVLGKIAASRARVKRIEAQAASIVKREKEDIAFFEARYGSDLEEYARELLAGNKRAKSVKLLEGTLGFRTSPARLVIEDKDPSLRKWLEKNRPGLLHREMMTSIKRDELTSLLTVTEDGNVVFADTGEHFEWAEVKPTEEKFYVK